MFNWIRSWALRLLEPVLRWIGKVHLPFTHKKVSGLHYYKIGPVLKPGLIFLTRTEGDLTSLLIPGFWSHAAIYSPCADRVADETVVQAQGAGVIEQDLISFMTSRDFVLALEPAYLGDKKDQIMARAAAIAREQLGKPYDFDFDFQISNQKAFYCSELVWYSYDKACEELNVPSVFTPRDTWGEPTVTPNDIASATSKFTVVFDSRNVVDALK